MLIPSEDRTYGTLVNVLDGQASSNSREASAVAHVTRSPLTGEPLVTEDPFRLLSGKFGISPAFLIQFTPEKRLTLG
jgi:hypothetical protein